MIEVTQEELQIGLKLHKKWLDNKIGGEQLMLSSRNISKIEINHGDFTKVYLPDTKFTDSTFKNAKFKNAYLVGADFSNMNLEGTDFSGANLRGASFENVNLEAVNFSGVNLSDVCFKNEYFSEVNTNMKDLNYSLIKIKNHEPIRVSNLETIWFNLADISKILSSLVDITDSSIRSSLKQTWNGNVTKIKVKQKNSNNDGYHLKSLLFVDIKAVTELLNKGFHFNNHVSLLQKDYIYYNETEEIKEIKQIFNDIENNGIEKYKIQPTVSQAKTKILDVGIDKHKLRVIINDDLWFSVADLSEIISSANLFLAQSMKRMIVKNSQYNIGKMKKFNSDLVEADKGKLFINLELTQYIVSRQYCCGIHSDDLISELENAINDFSDSENGKQLHKEESEIINMENLKVFKNDEFGQVRSLEVNGEFYFVGKDVAESLGYKNTKDALIKHIDEEDKRIIQKSQFTTFDIPPRGLTVINESGLYSLVLSSKLPTAKKFKKWVTSEILPSIRKNGGYINNQENLTEEEIIAKALVVAQNIISKKDKYIKDNEHKVEFFDTVTESKDTFDMNTVAKIINDKNIGRTKLFEILRQEKILMSNNQPYQRFIDNGWFRVIESKYTKLGEICVNYKTVVYQKGVDGIIKVLKKREV